MNQILLVYASQPGNKYSLDLSTLHNRLYRTINSRISFLQPPRSIHPPFNPKPLAMVESFFTLYPWSWIIKTSFQSRIREQRISLGWKTCIKEANIPYSTPWCSRYRSLEGSKPVDEIDPRLNLRYRIVSLIRTVSYLIAKAGACSIYTMRIWVWYKALVPIHFLYTNAFLIGISSYMKLYGDSLYRWMFCQ